jgi:hypothetical protein
MWQPHLHIHTTHDATILLQQQQKVPPKISQRANRTAPHVLLLLLPLPLPSPPPPSSPSRPPPFPFPFESPRQLRGSVLARSDISPPFAGPLRFQPPLPPVSLTALCSPAIRAEIGRISHRKPRRFHSADLFLRDGIGLDWIGIGLVVDLLLRGRTRPSSSPKLGHAHASSRSCSRAAAPPPPPPPLLLDPPPPTPHPHGGAP